GHAALAQTFHLAEQRVERHDHAVADQAYDPVAEDSGRYQMQHGLLAADHQRVPGVVAALEPHDGLRSLREHIHDCTLSFVTPLGADHDDVASHVTLSRATKSATR